MEEIKSWACSVCAAAVCGAVFKMMFPEGNLQKIFKCVICVFFLCTVISPLMEIELPDFKNIADSEYDFPKENTEFNDISAKVIEEQIIADTSELLLDDGIVLSDISVKINISGSGGIDINKFALTLDRNYDFNMIKEKVKQKIGIEPEIFVSGEKTDGNS